MSTEKNRLAEAGKGVPWRKWGPYLSERQWGTVREDYSAGGDAWGYFTHDESRSRAYRWGEDGLAGISDDHQRICFALALWNGKDPILKERLFGLTNSEGNHGEDVKEYYFYLDSTPTHSYMKYLYKYPQGEFPYGDLVNTNKNRSRFEMEYELLDTGIFNENRYFDVFAEYAKENPEKLLIRITVVNRGPEASELHILPTLWFRNTWASWHSADPVHPVMEQIKSDPGFRVVDVFHPDMDSYRFYCEGEIPLLFADNVTNNQRLFPQFPNESSFPKDGINNFVVNRQENSLNPDQRGTKVSPHYIISLEPGEKKTIQMILVSTGEGGAAGQEPVPSSLFGPEFGQVFKDRIHEADAFYRSVIPPTVSPDAAGVLRQAIAGMLWSKQFYYFDADKWLDEHHAHPLKNGSRMFRNTEWFHMVNQDIISMPDKWEYPWYAAWDLAFHTIPVAMVDPLFAKDQIQLILNGLYLHPNGQLPAYEWNFSDVNPPVHSWATLFLYRTLQGNGITDVDFLKSAFNKLLLNFTWWLNRKDRFGKNVFEGGFLGLDNIGVFDRSAPLPTGGHLEQADGTAWMALFTQNMLEMSVELAVHDKSYEDMVFKFVEHFLYIAAAMNKEGGEGMWDEEDGFYYDLLRFPDGSAKRLKVRSMVGLLPICATTVIEKWQREKVPEAMNKVIQRGIQMPELLTFMHPTGPGHLGVDDRGILALVNQDKLRRILSKMLDENEFLSPYGIRSLSKYHEKHPYIFSVEGMDYNVSYLPAESDTGMFGGNSNWRGPVWMPVNILLIRSLLNFYLYYGDNFKVECPTGSGKLMNLYEISKEIADRLIGIFLRNEQGIRPVYGGTAKFQHDPEWKDYLLFYEYFHGDNGAGLGASHQTGWTGLVAKLIQLFADTDSAKALMTGKISAFRSGRK